MCLWILTTCLNLLPVNYSPVVIVPVASPSIATMPVAPTMPPATTPTSPPQTVPITTVPTPAPTPPPTMATTLPITLPPDPVVTATSAPIALSGTSGVVLPLVICSNPQIVCALNPNQLTGRSAPNDPRLGTASAPSEGLNKPPITGYSAQVPSFDTAVKFPRFRRSLVRKRNKKVSNSRPFYILSNHVEHKFIKRQSCECVSAGTCPSSRDMATLTVPVQCSEGRNYCCDDFSRAVRKRLWDMIQEISSSTSTTIAYQTGFAGNLSQGVLMRQTEYISVIILIHALNVLTAAHKVLPYVHSETSADLKVRMGEMVASQVNPVLNQECSVNKMFSNPKYISNTLQEDIAVIKLSSALSFTPNVKAAVIVNRACLPTAATIFPGQRCVVARLGPLGPNGVIKTTSHKMKVKIIDPTRCQSLLRATRMGPNFKLDAASFICAEGKMNKDVCTGGYGSSLICQVKGKWVLLGLFSSRFGCGSTNVPGVYIKVSSFLPWIKQ